MREVEHFVVLFDEFFNCVVKTNKTDLDIRLLDADKDSVARRYYSSVFLGESCGNDIGFYFKQCLGPLEKEKLL